MSLPLVLSLFPGIGLLDMAFEEEGFCVVRGPDVLWGGDIRCFHPPAGHFAGVIGGPPCQSFSKLAKLVRAQGHEPTFGNLIPEFERCVSEAMPQWFVMENVTDAPEPQVTRYAVHSQLLNNRWLGEEQNRLRRFAFGTCDGRRLQIETVALEAALLSGTVISAERGTRSARQWSGATKAVVAGPNGAGGREGRRPNQFTQDISAAPPTVTAGGGLGPRQRSRNLVPGSVTSSDGGASKKMWRYTAEQACALQGVPADRTELLLKHAPFRADARLKAIANGVPLPMGRAIAKAVRRAMYPESCEASA